MIPIYNQPEYIEKAIESALNQDYKDVEVIVSDDSTNGDVGDKVQRFQGDRRFQYSRNAQNIGRVANYRKLLFEMSKGDWVIMLDGDDYFTDNNYITKCVDIVSKNRDIVLVGGGLRVVHSSTGVEQNHPLVDRDSIFSGADIFKKNLSLPNHQTDFYPRGLACKLDFYRDPSMASDSESLFRLCLNGKVAFLSTIAAAWRIHESNTTYTLNIKKQIRELVFIDKVFDYSIQYISLDEAVSWRCSMYEKMMRHLSRLSYVTPMDLFFLYLKVRKYISVPEQRFLLKETSKVFLTSTKSVLTEIFAKKQLKKT